MTITTEDMTRIAAEIGHSVDREEGEDHRERAEEWAESQGMEPKVMAFLCNVVREAFENSLRELSMKLGEKEVEIEGEAYVEANPDAMIWAIENTILASFRWGWEAAKQYAPSTAIEEETDDDLQG